MLTNNKGPIGGRDAYREPPDTWLMELILVEVLKHGPSARSGKVRIRWLGGEWEGPDAWVPKRRLLVSWSWAEAFLEDERRMVEALEYVKANEVLCEGRRSPGATTTVFRFGAIHVWMLRSPATGF